MRVRTFGMLPNHRYLEQDTDHLTQTQTPAGQYGENLYAGTAATTGINDAVSNWMGEVVNYNYSNPGFSSTTGHFTQVVWKATKQVTCALAACPKGTIFANYASRYIVCRYLPPGNYIGQFAQNVGRPVTNSTVVSKSRK
jgi:pathogenesis-related protein 1